MDEILAALHPDYGMSNCQRWLGGMTLIAVISAALLVLWIARVALSRKDDL